MNSTIYDRPNAGKERNMKKFLCLFLVLSLVCIHPAGQAATYTRVEDTAVALMDITFSCGCTRMGAGTMIAVNGLITAGHNLLCSKHNQKLKTCTFYFINIHTWHLFCVSFWNLREIGNKDNLRIVI